MIGVRLYRSESSHTTTAKPQLLPRRGRASVMAVKDDVKVKDKDKEAKEKKEGGGKKGGKKEEEKEPELSDEDLEVKKNLDLMVERVNDPEPGIRELGFCSRVC